MNKSIKAAVLVFCLTIFSAVLLNAQVLESVPDSELLSYEEEVLDGCEPEHPRFYEECKNTIPGIWAIGSTMGGSSGLAVMPTPDFSEKGVKLGFKRGITKSEIKSAGTLIKHEKDEKIANIRAKATDKLEVSLNNITYERSFEPAAAASRVKEEIYALGMKYSERLDDGTEYCVGFNYAPMSADEINVSDVEQIENMRSVYITFSDMISNKLAAYGEAACAVTKDQKLNLGSMIRKIERSELITGAVGLDWRFGEHADFFSEIRISNYRDLYREDKERYRLHAGFRFGFEGVSAEVIGLNLTEDDPILMVGGSIGF